MPGLNLKKVSVKGLKGLVVNGTIIQNLKFFKYFSNIFLIYSFVCRVTEETKYQEFYLSRYFYFQKCDPVRYFLEK